MSGGLMQWGQRARLLRRAYNGDQQAAMQLVEEGIEVYRDKIEGLEAELDYHRQEHWDHAASLEDAYNRPEEEQIERAIGAFDELMNTVLFITAGIPVTLASEGEEAQVWAEEVKEKIVDLFLMLHNPEFRYAILAVMDEPVRDEADNYLDRINLETWGTLNALVKEGEGDIADLPPETRAVVQTMQDRLDRPQGAD